METFETFDGYYIILHILHIIIITTAYIVTDVATVYEAGC